MAQEAVQTNLARKWRSKTFNQVVGQDLAVRILQNSLFKNYFFPVYLFAGQRGCGKTTSARLFAAALNCHALATFQQDPRSCSLPCLTCPSCIAMNQNSHPDFIEIDAASHTGVDNVRQIIDAASLMPVMGSKKVYLIDEAHMLSKAAFNAFLKILEEPPASVIFMLATTDPHKIIDTVRSRCFQLFFGPIAADDLQKHLMHICQEEQIKADPQALYTIVHEAEGSARDALNLLEQVRFSHIEVSQEAVLKVVGHLPESVLLSMVETVINQDAAGLIQLLATLKLEQASILSIWNKILMILKALLHTKYHVPTTNVQDHERLQSIAVHTSPAWLAQAIRHVYSYEQTLLKTTAQADLLELMLLELIDLVPAASSQAIAPNRTTVAKLTAPIAKISATPQQVAEKTVTTENYVEEQPAPQIGTTIVTSTPVDARWAQFLQSIEQLSDPLLLSIFKQADFIAHHTETQQVELLFSKEATFFGQWLDQTRTVWESRMHTIFDAPVRMQARFEKEQTASRTTPVRRELPPTASSTQKPETKQAIPPQNKKPFEQKFTKKPASVSSAALLPSTVAIDVKDKEKWPKAHQLLEQFGGTISEIKGDINYAE